MAGSLPEEPGLPTTCHQTQYHDVELVSANVRTPDAPVSSRLRSASGHPVTSGTTTLEPMGSSVVKPQATHANDQSVGGLPLDRSATTPLAAQQKPEVLTLKDNTTPQHQQQSSSSPEVLTLVPNHDSGTSMAEEIVTQNNESDWRVEDVTLSVSRTNSHLHNMGPEGYCDRSSAHIHADGYRTPTNSNVRPNHQDLPKCQS